MADTPTKDRETIIPKGRPDILAKEIGQETILYSDTDEAIHVLNATAKLIWKLCDGQHSLEDIARKLQEEFAVPEQHDVFADIQHTIKIFSEKGLLLGGEG